MESTGSKPSSSETAKLALTATGSPFLLKPRNGGIQLAWLAGKPPVCLYTTFLFALSFASILQCLTCRRLGQQSFDVVTVVRKIRVKKLRPHTEWVSGAKSATHCSLKLLAPVLGGVFSEGASTSETTDSPSYTFP